MNFKEMKRSTYSLMLDVSVTDSANAIVNSIFASGSVSKISRDTMLKEIVVGLIVESFSKTHTFEEVVKVNVIDSNKLLNTEITISTIPEVDGTIYNYD
jgi:hypothetical protein